jgi:hypothetical protein
MQSASSSVSFPGQRLIKPMPLVTMATLPERVGQRATAPVVSTRDGSRLARAIIGTKSTASVCRRCGRSRAAQPPAAVHPMRSLRSWYALNARVGGGRGRLGQPQASAPGAALSAKAIVEIMRRRTAQPAEACGGRQPIRQLAPRGARAPASSRTRARRPRWVRTLPCRPLHVYAAKVVSRLLVAREATVSGGAMGIPLRELRAAHACNRGAPRAPSVHAGNRRGH